MYPVSEAKGIDILFFQINLISFLLCHILCRENLQIRKCFFENPAHEHRGKRAVVLADRMRFVNDNIHDNLRIVNRRCRDKGYQTIFCSSLADL